MWKELIRNSTNPPTGSIDDFKGFYTSGRCQNSPVINDVVVTESLDRVEPLFTSPPSLSKAAPEIDKKNNRRCND